MTDTRARPYRLQRRLEAMAETRDKIARAAFELHATVGPSQATISAVAERAGVERHTVYRHYPDMVSLIRACTLHGMEVTGLPQPDRWASIPEPLVRLRAALEGMYAYYRANEALIANILRDLPVMPELAAGSSRLPGPPRPHLGHRPGPVDATAWRPRGPRPGAREHGPRVRDLAGPHQPRRAERSGGRGHDGRIGRSCTDRRPAVSAALLPSTMDPEAILAGLNDEQREAATATTGPVVILAGAGPARPASSATAWRTRRPPRRSIRSRRWS